MVGDRVTTTAAPADGGASPSALRQALTALRLSPNNRRLVGYVFLAIILVSGSVAAWQISSLLSRGADQMTRYVRVDAWAVQQAEYELQQVRSRIARHIAGDADVSLADVRAQLAVARETIALVRRSEDYERFNVLVDIEGVSQAVLDAVEEVERVLGNRDEFRDDLPTLHHVEEALARPADLLRQLAVDVAHVRLELQDGDLENVRWLVGVNQWMLFGSLAVAGIFIALLLLETYNARRAERAAKKNAEHTRYLAEHDPLTGLANRAIFQQRLGDQIELAEAEGGEILLYLLDLNGFKDINDTFGHDFGDEVLVRVAKHLEMCVHEHDTLVRLGGDEFAVIQAAGAGHSDWDTTAKKLVAAFEQPFRFNERRIHLGTSIGVARFPSDGQDVGSLLKSADLALYSAKALDSGHVEHFRPQMMTELRDRRTLEDALREALFENKLELFYQPQIDLQSGRCIGAESLLRWHHEELGWVSPAAFIPVAEKSGLILPIGRWVMETACRAALTWRGENADATVAVNVSPPQFIYEDIVEEVRSVLETTGLPPHRLELEITEGLLMREEKTAIKALEGLNDLGVALAIDDFGTGYSSLSYIKRFRVQKLKVDRSFVMDMEEDNHDKMIVRMILDLAAGLGMQTIAEGIETTAQMDMLTELGCQEGQGFLFSKAIPLDEFRDFQPPECAAPSRAKTANLVHLPSTVRSGSPPPTQKEAV